MSPATATRPAAVAKAQTANGKPGVAIEHAPLWQYTPPSPGYRIQAANTELGFTVEIQALDAHGRPGAWKAVDTIPVVMLRPLLGLAGLLPNS